MLNVTQTFLPPFEEYGEILREVWASKWLTNRGVLVRRLEDQLKERLGVPHILLVSNGTLALQIPIKALQLSGEIITTPFSYVATVSSIVWENCTPIFVDIDPEYLTIDERRIESAITAKTSAILATHVFGNPCDVESIEQIANKHDLKVIYDAAHCFGVNYKGQSILNWGDVSTLSFHATKLFHTGEGGAIICRETEVAKRVFQHHNFGHDGPEKFHGLGINGKMSELNAAMGLAVLQYVDAIVDKRRELCEVYDAAVTHRNSSRLKLRYGTEWNFCYYPVIFESEEVMLRVKESLNGAGVFPRRYFYPSLNELPYILDSPMPIAEDISRRILCLPLSFDMTPEQIGFVTAFL